MIDITYKEPSNINELRGLSEEVNYAIVKGGKTRKYVVYKKPIPHILLPNKSPQLRGWYKDKHEPLGRRNRPCYSEAFLTRPYAGFCPVGCVFCLSEGTTIRTVIRNGKNKISGGIKKIEDINVGDLIWGFKDNISIPTKVIGKWGGYKSDLLEITLSNKKNLKVTSDHKIYTENRGWVKANNLDIELDILLDYTELQNITSRFKRRDFMKLHNPMFNKEIEDLEIIHCVKILSIKKLEGEQIVYDLQTTTENFFAENILVHNCYVNFGVRGYRLTHTTTVDPYYPEKIDKDLNKLKTATIGYISSFTECFNPLESIYHITERLSEVFTKYQLPIFYLTRQIVPQWGIEYLLKNKYSYLQYSINTSNEEIWRRLSPRAASLKDIFSQIKNISDKIYIGWQVNPIIPGIITYEELEQLIELGISIGVKHFIFKFVEQDIGNYKSFKQQLQQRFINYPERLEYFNNTFGQNVGNQISTNYVIRLEWLKKLHQKFITIWKDKATMGLCYEYKPSQINLAGESLGETFTTAHQCHGKRVPIFVRRGSRFEPLESCYGNCLYCEEKGKVSCNNSILPQAKALKWKDWSKISILTEDKQE